MCKVGDKFIIEIGSEYPANPFEDGENGKAPTILYKIKGFNSLVFDENGLDKLVRYDFAQDAAYDDGFEAGILNAKDKDYEKGLSDAWECLKKIRNSNEEELREIFNLPFATRIKDVLNNFTPQEAIDKLKKWEEKQEIKAGDIVTVDGLAGDFVVTWCKEGKADCMNLSTGAFCIINCEKLVKTGKHIDLTEIFKGLEVI